MSFNLSDLMASSLSPQAPVKRLRELLREQQEPFMLDAYLLERGVFKRRSSSEAASPCCSGNSSKCCKSFGSSKRRTKRFPHNTKFLGSVFSKLVSSNDTKKLSNHPNRAGVSLPHIAENIVPVAELNRYSSASSLSAFESFSGSDTEEQSSSSKRDQIQSSTNTFRALTLSNPGEEQAATDMKLRWGVMEDSKQLSPVSVLEELPSSFGEGSPVHNKVQQNRRLTSKETIPSTSISSAPWKVSEDSILSASMWNLLIRSLREKQGANGVVQIHDLIGSQFLNTKRVLQQTKQLLFDCVKEAIEIHARKGRRRHYVKEPSGPEEIGKTICEQLCLWGRQSAELKNITELITADFSASTGEWSDFEPQIKEISMELGDGILEDVMEDIVQFLFHH